MIVDCLSIGLDFYVPSALCCNSLCVGPVYGLTFLVLKLHVNSLPFLMLLWIIYFKNLNTLLFVYVLDYLLSTYLLWQSIYSQIFSLLWVIIFLAFWEFSADSVCKSLIVCDLQIFSPISLFSFFKVSFEKWKFIVYMNSDLSVLLCIVLWVWYLRVVCLIKIINSFTCIFF